MKIINKFFKVIFIFLGILFLISTILLIQIFWQSNQKQFLEIVFLDVGQGDAIFIETPNGFKILIDGGPNSAVVRSVAKFLPFYNRKIDLLIATHSDSDHVAGFVEVLKRFNVQYFAQNYIIDTDALNTEIKRLISTNYIDQLFLKSGDKIILDKKENIYIEILWPPMEHEESDNNDNSLITRIVYGNIKVILTGDASKEIEEKIYNKFIKNSSNASSVKKIESNILKAGHHGSKTSTSKKFLEMINPRYVIISAGKDNRFGHPHQEVIDTIENFSHSQNSNQEDKIKILETAVLGSIHFKSDGDKLWFVE